MIPSASKVPVNAQETAATLIRVLESVLTALNAGDAIKGADLLAKVQEICDSVVAEGIELPPEDLKRAADLHQRCLAASARLGPTLLASLLQSATIRKASNAYGSEP